MDALKHALDTINSGVYSSDNFDNLKKNCDTDCNNNFFDKLPEKYSCEGSPDKLMLEALKELNIHDIKDFLNKAKPPDKPFKKNTCAAPAQYHLESSRGMVKDRLSAYQLQLYFGGKKLKRFLCTFFFG